MNFLPPLSAVLLACTTLSAAPVYANTDDFSIAIIAAPMLSPNGDAAFHEAINATDDDNLAFVVVNGIKSAQEPCSDAVYLERKLLLDAAKNGVIVSLAGTDWVNCRDSNGRSNTIDRLTRLRELFFADDLSFGASKIPLMRQSNAEKFRRYAENSRWEVGPILFATINLPAENNHYLAAGGRNNEFEDRQIANRNWLQRLGSIAHSHKNEALVIFCDADPFKPNDKKNQRDGFADIRIALANLATTFPGRILLVHRSTAPIVGTPSGISWNGNLGSLAVANGLIKLHVATDTAALFSLVSATEASSSHAVHNKKTADPK